MGAGTVIALRAAGSGGGRRAAGGGGPSGPRSSQTAARPRGLSNIFTNSYVDVSRETSRKGSLVSRLPSRESSD